VSISVVIVDGICVLSSRMMFVPVRMKVIR